MANPKYFQDDLDKKFAHLAEECSEYLTAYNKMVRWGAFSYNPELESDEREYNIHWVQREMEDIRTQLDRVQASMEDIGPYGTLNMQYTATLEEAFPLYNE